MGSKTRNRKLDDQERIKKQNARLKRQNKKLKELKEKQEALDAEMTGHKRRRARNTIVVLLSLVVILLLYIAYNNGAFEKDTLFAGVIATIASFTLSSLFRF